jgi:hypothetical protein
MVMMTSPLIGACDTAYPEVVVVNRIDSHTLVKNISFNGCVWDQVLAFEETTSPGRCLPGKDRIHFKKLDIEAYCQDQVEYGHFDMPCSCGKAGDCIPDGGVDSGLTDEEPNWFNYQTISAKRVEYGDFDLFEIVIDDIEQDFSVPGPYGH